MRRSLTYALAFCLASTTALANKDKPGWSGEGEFGLAITSGNTDTKNLNGRLKLINNRGLWRDTIGVEALSFSDNNTTTAERYTFNYKADRKISANEYLFGAFRYDDDRFSGFDYQSSLTAGYGRRLFERARSHLDAEIGGGYRFSETIDGESQNQSILRLYGNYEYDVSDNSVFSQTLLIEPGPDNTFTESVTGFKVGFAEKLALKLSLAIRTNSDTPAGTSSTDKITSAAVVYSF